MHVFKRIWLLALILALGHTAFSQVKYKGFELPKDARYQRGMVAVKVKEAHVAQFARGHLPLPSNLRISTGASTPQPFVEHNFYAQLRAQRAGKPAAIDLRKYYYLPIDPQKNIEQVIDELYATGLFEIVEPCYTAKIHYTPNDPQQSSQYYLDLINAFEAWDITKGDTNIVVAVADDAVNYNHPDLAANIHYNYADPINGQDDDGDGFIDNFRGWDFAGPDSLQTQPDNDPMADNSGLSHGTAVSGCVSGVADNGQGIAGIGFKVKIMPLKCAFNNAPDGVSFGYNAIIYAANHGADVINCSWGSGSYSQIAQDICTYAVVDQNALVVASAGNSGSATPNYPAAYEYVISVASSTAGDAKSNFSNFGEWVSITAPGSNIMTTDIGGGYASVNGTSFSSPITAGAAALVKSHYPDMSAKQIGELIRVTADPSIYEKNSSSFAGKLGIGRLDVHRALTLKRPAIRMEDTELLSVKTGNVAKAGDTATFAGRFINYLFPSSAGMRVKITSSSNALRVINGEATIGELGMMEVKDNKLNPFLVFIQPNVGKNFLVTIKLEYTDIEKEYKDVQFFQVLINPTYITVAENDITASVGNNGRLGYEGASQTNGDGFVFDEKNLLYEMSMVMGTGPTKIANASRGVSGSTLDNDFVAIQDIQGIRPGKDGTFEASGKFNDNNAGDSKIGVEVDYRAMAWSDDAFRSFIIMEYVIKNTGSEPLENYHVGLYADWDIGVNGGSDSARWNNDLNMGYVYDWKATDRYYAGIQNLTGSASYFAIYNDHRIPGVPFGVYDGFSDQEKWTALSSGIGNMNAGTTTDGGSDVSHLVGSGPHRIEPGQTIKVAFALHGGKNTEDLFESGEAANTMYHTILALQRPTAADGKACYGGSATLTASGGTNYRWYHAPAGGEPISSSASLEVSPVYSDTTLFVALADHDTYESRRVAVKITPKAVPNISSTGGTTFCEGDSIKLIVPQASTYLWTEASTGKTFSTQSIVVKKADSYSVVVTDTELGCSNASATVTTAIKAKPVVDFAVTLSDDQRTITLQNQSVGELSYVWNFGNGEQSTQASPIYTYPRGGNLPGTFNISLTGTDANGCKNSKTIAFEVTALEESALARQMSVYPNPSQGMLYLNMGSAPTGQYRVLVMDLAGRVMQSHYLAKQGQSDVLSIESQSLASGTYLLYISHESAGVAVKRFVKE